MDTAQWQEMEAKALEVFSKYGYKEIRTPIFEATELFLRGVGDTTDIVNKEMYTFEKNERSLTLRPENTAGVVRAYIENGMSRLSAPVKLWYKGPQFRYERPQAGRQRQFHQVGVELFGIKEATADAEVIMTAIDYLNALGLCDLDVEINSLGCQDCREGYKKRIKETLKQVQGDGGGAHGDLCEDCQSRYEKNPLRILDCKVPACNALAAKIDKDFICEECAEHFNRVKAYLDELKIKYTVNKMIVRGLDYYNRTVFEIKSNSLGSQNAVCGGGRYDSLVKTLGGEDTPAVGWAMGMERLASLMAVIEPKKLDAYIVSNATAEAFKLAQELRATGLSVEFDLSNKKIKKQFEKAAKAAKATLILRDDGMVSIETASEKREVKRSEICQMMLKK